MIYLPLVAIGDPEAWDEVDAAARRADAGEYEWVLFASVNAVERFVSRVHRLGLALRARVGAVGPATTDALRSRDVDVFLIPETFTAADLAEALGPGQGRVLMPRVQGGPREPVAALEERGWIVDEVAVYRNVPASADSPEGEEVRAGRFDAITLLSGSAARNLAAVVGNLGPVGLAPNSYEPKLVVCIGPQTAAAARESGLRVDLVAQQHTAAGVVDALVRYYA